MAIYAGEWEKYEDVVGTYSELPPESMIVYAAYDCQGYDGSALIVFERDGKLFENNDGHCSCNGLDSWEPEETTPEALMIRQGWEGLHTAVASVVLERAVAEREREELASTLRAIKFRKER